MANIAEKLSKNRCDRRETAMLSEREYLLGQNLPLLPITATESDELVCPSERISSIINFSDNETADSDLLEVGVADSGPEETEELRTNSDHHCHAAEPPADTVARNQLIAVSILCFVFMLAEIIGMLVFKFVKSSNAIGFYSELVKSRITSQVLIMICFDAKS